MQIYYTIQIKKMCFKNESMYIIFMSTIILNNTIIIHVITILCSLSPNENIIMLSAALYQG